MFKVTKYHLVTLLPYLRCEGLLVTPVTCVTGDQQDKIDVTVTLTVTVSHFGCNSMSELQHGAIDLQLDVLPEIEELDVLDIDSLKFHTYPCE